MGEECCAGVRDVSCLVLLLLGDLLLVCGDAGNQLHIPFWLPRRGVVKGSESGVWAGGEFVFVSSDAMMWPGCPNGRKKVGAGPLGK